MAIRAGAVCKRTIGSTAVGRMLIGTVPGVLIIPGLYFIFATLAKNLKFSNRKEEKPFTESIQYPYGINNHHNLDFDQWNLCHERIIIGFFQKI
jgi:hypothetical protein